MKKLKYFLLSFMLMVLAVFGVSLKPTTKAVAIESKMTYENYSAEVNTILTEFCGYKSRIAGSDNEKEASEYIKNYILTNIPALTAKNNLSTINGVQSFKFVSDYTGLYKNSQNIIFEYKTTSKTDKKVILSCNYDAPVKYDSEKNEYVSFENDALNVSGAGVASLLMLAKILPNYNFNFNLEFVFFGAGENSCAGSSFYLDGISKDDAKNVLSVINIDKVGVGKNIYFYMDEVSTKLSNFVSKNSGALIKQVDLIHLNKTEVISSELGLTYTHIGLDSDNVKFMKRGIATINLFAGEYEDGIIMGRNEFNGQKVISYTANDTIEYIKTTYGEDKINDNLYKINCAVETLLTNENFESVASKSYNQTSWLYGIFANEKLALYLTIVMFIVIIIIAMFTYYKLTVKSYYSDVETEFLSSVVKISDQIGEDSEGDVTKMVGMVIANDIKKDKTLKREKNKKKNKK